MRGLASAFSNFNPDATQTQQDFALNTFEAMKRSQLRILGDTDAEREPSPVEEKQVAEFVLDSKKSETVEMEQKYSSLATRLSTRKYSDGIFMHEKVPL